MLKAQQKGGKKPRDELGCSWRWAEVRILPCRAVFLSVDFHLALPVPLLLHFLGRKWPFLAVMLPWLDMCITNACLNIFTWFQWGSVSRWPLYFTCCPTREQPVPGKSCYVRALWVLPALSLGSQPAQGHIFTSLSFATRGHQSCCELLTIPPWVAYF